MKNGNKKYQLTDKEKWECTARWLNALYRAYDASMAIGKAGHSDGFWIMLGQIGERRPGLIQYSVKEARDSSWNYTPCVTCPLYSTKCSKIDSNSEERCPQSNFKVLEKYTGLDTIYNLIPYD